MLVQYIRVRYPVAALSCIVMICSITGCNSDSHVNMRVTKAKLDDIKENMTRTEVEQLLGQGLAMSNDNSLLAVPGRRKPTRKSWMIWTRNPKDDPKNPSEYIIVAFDANDHVACAIYGGTATDRK